MGIGRSAPKSPMHIITELDPITRSIVARNSYNTEFGDPVAFFDVNESAQTYTADREFIGRNGSLRNPER